MTVSSFDLPISYTGSGTRGPFATGFYFLEDSHLLVKIVTIATGEEETLQLNTDYSVSGSGDPSGGDVTLTVSYGAISSSYKIVIDLAVPYTQEVDYQENDPFPAESHETALDKLTMLAKQNQLLGNKGLRIPNDEDLTTLLPRAVDRANKALIFDEDGNVTVSTDDYEDQTATVAADAASAASSATDAETAQTAAEAAQASAESAAASAALYAAKLAGTSSTSVTIATGSKSFTTQSGKFFDVGNYLMIASSADPSNYMHGQVTAYSGTSLTVNVTNTGGTGTLSDWIILLSGTRGATGATGAQGPAGSGSGDMLRSNNLSDVISASTARTNLGLGTIATQNSSGVTITGGTITGITDLAVADGGTGASDAAGARTNLGLGTAATKDTGTSAGNVVVLDGSAKLPAVDGSQLTNLASSGGVSNAQTFTASGTWTKPGSGTIAYIQAWGAGGGGSTNASGGGGGGGAYAERWMPLSALGSTVTVTIGAGGSAGAGGTAGGDSSFGTHVVAYGGGGGNTNAGGGGGGGLSAGANASSGNSGAGGGPVAGSGTSSAGNGGDSAFGGGGGGNGTSGFGGSSAFGGGGGGGGTQVGGNSIYGGGGGARTASSPASTSVYGGNGGGTGVAGTAPGGGGGRNAAGARGEIRVYVF